VSTLLDPKFAVCRHACGWELACATQQEKERREEIHAAHAHMTVSAITELLTADPSNERDKRAIVSAIEVAARANGGRVSANDVRPLLPPYVLPNLIGAVFTSLRNSGRLVPTGDAERSKDTKGRNTNKDCPIYILRDTA
jgi:hypothetical protein